MTTTDPNLAGDMTGEVVAGLAAAWKAIRVRHDEVPPVVLAAGAHRRGTQRVRLAHFKSLGWSPVYEGEPPELRAARAEFDDAIANGDPSAALGASALMFAISAAQLSEDAKACLSEVFLTDHGLSGSSADVLATLLHEAAHAIADRRGIKDTSRQGRYHNARFRALAEEVGLKVGRDPVIGWSPTVLTPATAAAYSTTLAELAKALARHVPDQSLVAVLGSDALECDCGRWVREQRRPASKPRAALCGVCGSRLRRSG